MDDTGKGFAAAHGRADFFDRIQPGDYLEAVLYDGETWSQFDGRAVHPTTTHVWGAETNPGKRLRKTHKFRCTQVPSPEQVRERAAAIRAGWTRAEMLKRGKSLQTALDHLANPTLYAKRKEAARDYRDKQRAAEKAGRHFTTPHDRKPKKGERHGHP